MSELTNKAAYLRGLADGLKLDTEKSEGKLISAMLDLMNDMAEKISDLDEEQGFITDSIDELEDVIKIIGDEIADGHEHNYDCDCEDEEDLYKLICPTCDEEIVITADDIDERLVVCPKCGEEIELAFECDCEDDDCDCDDDDCGCGCGHED